ncbi:hypothetical protein Y032_0986g3295 [Ancylostoma ceylanicum]|uniref:Uncharacterized protein n=1 Tax=Ancylostoma ceylanicum TaxID=53326 RepID=A0A016W819_9BILA|nr:hypothetical protein Y032_0986g3295 [Ancylostoma ceylanicum]
MMKNRGQSHRSRIAIARVYGLATAALSFHWGFHAALAGLHRKSFASGCVRLIVASGINCPINCPYATALRQGGIVDKNTHSFHATTHPVELLNYK